MQMFYSVHQGVCTYQIALLLFLTLLLHGPGRCPLGLMYTTTNEGREKLNSGESELSQRTIEVLIQRTKRKGRGKALKTILVESEQKGNDNVIPSKPPQSSSDDETPRRSKRDDSAERPDCGR